jgi:hypothetical protein
MRHAVPDQIVAVLPDNDSVIGQGQFESYFGALDGDASES